MATYLSPGVYDTEVDYSTNVSAVSTAIAGMVGTFNKGEVGVPTLITNTMELVDKFGTSILNSISFLSARDFLRYGNQLWVVRAAGTGVATAVGSIKDAADNEFIAVAAKTPGSYYNNLTEVVVVNRNPVNRLISVVVYYAGVVVESYIDVTYDKTSTDNYFESVINEKSQYIEVEDKNILGKLINFNTSSCILTGGSDGIVQTSATTSKAATAKIGAANKGMLISLNTTGTAGNEMKIVVTLPQTPNADLTVTLTNTTLNIILGTNNNGQPDNEKNLLASIGYEIAKLAQFTIVSLADDAEFISTVQTINFVGGTDAAESDGVGEAEIYKALDSFSSAERINVNILMTPGFSYPACIKKAATLCENRGDCMFLVDPPFGLTYTQAVDWHNGNGGEFAAFNSSYLAMYRPWIKEFDEYNNINRWVPPSGMVAGQYAYSDTKSDAWYAPAGLNRAILQNALALEDDMDAGKRDYIYSGGNVINPIVNFPTEGIVIWGNRTMSRKPSATDRVNVRRLLLYVRKAIALSSRYVVFEQNDYITWGIWKDMVTPFLKDIQSRRGLYAFRVQMDNTTVSNEDIDNYRMPGIVWLQPTKSAEFIAIRFTLVKTGAIFG